MISWKNQGSLVLNSPAQIAWDLRTPDLAVIRRSVSAFLKPFSIGASAIGPYDARVCHRRLHNTELTLIDYGSSSAGDQEMLNAAHASAWHWTEVGIELNRMRAIMLLAEVHALLGFGQSALAYAEEMRTYFLGVQSPDWELAFVHVVHAHAASAAGETEKHRASYGLAVAALGAISNEKERGIVAGTFNHVPRPDRYAPT
jgi:hypothetical protein